STTAPSKVTGGLPMPVSITAMVTPAPRVMCQASRIRAPSSQYSFARTGSLGSSGIGGGVGVGDGVVSAGTDASGAGAAAGDAAAGDAARIADAVIAVHT